MMTGDFGHVRGGPGDEGSALVMVLMMISMVSVLTLTLSTLSVNNLTGARRAHLAGTALNAADAGSAQAMAYIRANGVRVLECSPTCDSNPWGNEAAPAYVTTPGAGGASFKVWVKTIAPYPANDPGLYQIHSLGVTGGPAGRAITTDVSVTPHLFPMGVFGKSISGGGNVGVHHESIFTTGCVYQREKITFEGMDMLNGIPAGMHSSQIITTSNGNGVYCPTTRDPIHKNGTAARYCNPAFPYDQDSLGGPLTGPGCLGVAGAYPQTSLIKDDLDLFSTYKLTSPPLTSAELDQLKTVAMSQDNYRTTSALGASPDEENAVMYFELRGSEAGNVVNLSSLAGYGRPHGLSADSAGCLPRSLVIIVDGGDIKLNSNQQLAASVFVLADEPYGDVQKLDGTADFVGTLYANNIDMTGNADIYMDECFKANLSPSLFKVEASNYVEDDR